MSEFIDVEVKADFDGGAYPIPTKFRFSETEWNSMIVNVDRIEEVAVLPSRTDPIYVYRCESIVNSEHFVYELGFRKQRGKWHIRTL